MKLRDDVVRVFIFGAAIGACYAVTFWLIRATELSDRKNWDALILAIIYAAAIVPALIFFGQDYLGKGARYLQETRARFGNRYTFSRIMIAQLTVQARFSEPSESDALELAKCLWVENGHFRGKLAQGAIPFLNAEGRRRFVVVRGFGENRRECLIVAKDIGSIWIPKLVGGQTLYI